MTPRSLFSIVLKIIGLLFIKDVIDAIPQFISTVIQSTQYNSFGDAIWAPLFTLLFIALYACTAYYFIFKTDTLIDKLKLDQGFKQDNFPLNIHRSTILSIVIIIIGGLLIADNIPLLCRSVYLYVQSKSLINVLSKPPDFTYMIIYLVKIVIGLILTGNHQLLVNYIERKRKGNIIITETKVEE